MNLTLLHSSATHCAKFDAIRDSIAPRVKLVHMVQQDWLSEAQNGLSDTLALAISSWIRAQNTPVLCTCTTLGAVAEAAGALRIDRPLMQEAARNGGPVLMAYCLDSTLAPSKSLLREEMGAEGDVQTLDLTQHWALFETGDLAGFETALAKDVRATAPTSGCVVLAQASMAGAATLLLDLPVPVLASPELAFQAALQRVGLQIG